MSRIRRVRSITREMVRNNPDTVFVFGDNLMRAGFRGQAAAMRGEPNAIGIVTKRAPHSSPSAFLSDTDWASYVHETIAGDLSRVRMALQSGRDVVLPADGIGTGLADLERRAPKLFAFITESLAQMERDYD